MIEHERSYIFTHEGAYKFLSSQGCTKTEDINIEDSYLGKGMRVRKTWNGKKTSYVFTRKTGDKSKGYRFEFEEKISEKLAEQLTFETIMRVKKVRKKLNIPRATESEDVYTVTMDFIEEPMKLAVLEVEALSEVVFPIPADITYKLFGVQLKECPLCTYKLFNRHIGIAGGPSSGKCVVSDTLVYLPQKKVWETVESLNGEKIITLSYDTSSRQLVESNATVIDRGKQCVYRLKTRSGVEIETTDNHPFLRLDGSYTQLKDLRIGDHIGVIRRLKQKTKTKGTNYLGKMLGYLLGDGGLTGRSSVNFTNSEQYLIDDLRKCGKFIQKDICLIKNKNDKYTYRFTSGIQGGVSKGKNKILETVRQYGLAEKGSYAKSITPQIHLLSDVELEGLICAYFACDGHNAHKSNNCEFYSVSKNLLLGIRQILWRLGINSSFFLKNGKYKGERHVSYRLKVIDPESYALFGDLMHKHLPGYSKSFTHKQTGYKCHRSGGGIPADEAWKIVKAEAKKLNINFYPRNLRKKGSYKCRLRTPRNKYYSMQRLKDMNERIGSPEIEKLSQDDLYYDSIIGISKIGEKATYDLSVPGYNNFVANGIVVHNSETAKILSYTLNTQYGANSFHVAEFATTFIQKYHKNPNFWEEFFIWHGQHEREHSADSANIVISDCPTFLTYIYLLHLPKDEFSSDTALVLAKMYKRVLFDIEWYSDLMFLEMKEYKENAVRYQSQEEALIIQNRVRGFLDDHRINYHTYDYTQKDKMMQDLFYINEPKE